MQPFLMVTLEAGEKQIINENHVVKIVKGKGTAVIHLSTGEILHVVDPEYGAWENDLHIRK